VSDAGVQFEQGAAVAGRWQPYMDLTKQMSSTHSLTFGEEAADPGAALAVLFEVPEGIREQIDSVFARRRHLGRGEG
jgi:hypothetical protein